MNTENPALVSTLTVYLVAIIVSIGGTVFYFANRRNRREGGAKDNRKIAPPMDELGEAMPDLDTLTSPTEMPAVLSPRPAKKGTYSVSLTDGGSAEVVEVMAVLRDVADGSLIVQIGDKFHRSSMLEQDAEFTRRLNATMRDLAAGVREGAKAAAAPPEVTVPPVPVTPIVEQPPAPVQHLTETPPPAAEQPIEAPPPQTDDDGFELPDVEDITAAPKPARAGDLPGDLPRFRLPDTFEVPKRGKRVKPDSTPVPEINIGGAIEAFLQHRLALAPEFVGREIHIRSGIHGAIKIEVDGQFYDSVGEVADSAVRIFLQETVNDWQERQG